MKALVAGATGLVGREVVALLTEKRDVVTSALVRKSGSLAAPTTEIVFDYENAAAYEALADDPPDVFFCCLGTTRRKAGSDEAFLRVDRDYPLKLIAALVKGNKAARFGLVSSVGGDGGRGLYLGAKKAVEEALVASGLPHVIVRPSFLKGDRAEFRLGEKIGLVAVAPLLAGLGHISKSMKRFAPIEGREVAQALVSSVLSLGDSGKSEILEGDSLFNRAAV